MYIFVLFNVHLCAFVVHICLNLIYIFEQFVCILMYIFVHQWCTFVFFFVYIYVPFDVHLCSFLFTIM